VVVGIWLMARVFVQHPASRIANQANETLAGEVICK
jgi:hypothetical protein